MNILVLDFETYYDSDFTLKKMTTEAYIRDPRFEAHLLGVYDPARGHKFWLEQEDIAAWLAEIDWSKTAVLCHHAQFDGLILSHHYGIKPAAWLDTLSMAKCLVGNQISVSLSNLAHHYQLAAKTVPYDKFKGVRWVNLSDELRQELGEGCIHDCELTWQLFQRLAPDFPQEEYKVVDMTVRMFTEPRLLGDEAAFRKLQQDEWERKGQTLIDLGVTEGQLQSAADFCELLQQEGIEIEYKQGKPDKEGNQRLIPAVAKTDDFMKELQEHENDRVAQLASARLDVRSTIDATRAGRLAGMASRGPMPVYLSYCGANTTRWSGGDKVNFQNFPRGGDIRKAFRAPPGFKIIVIDESQIECRVLEYLAGEQEALDEFRRGLDPYIGVASKFYGEQVDVKDKARRGLGKLIRLSCGYGAGADSIVRTAARGTYGPAVKLSPEQGLAARNLYRHERSGVVSYWANCDRMLSALAGTNKVIEWGPLVVSTGRITAPSGLSMFYNLEYDKDLGSWMRLTRKGRRKIWGGVLTQNICEFVSRLILSQACLRILNESEGRFSPLWLTHDEAVYLVEDRWAEAALSFISDHMRRAPDWLPGIPLDVEGEINDYYAK